MDDISLESSYTVYTGCLNSKSGENFSMKAMESCDKSMTDLVGASTSIGTLRYITTNVAKGGPGRMPGV